MSQELVPIIDKGQRVDHYFSDAKTGVIYYLRSVSGRYIKFSTKVKLPNILRAKREANQELQRRMGQKKSKVSSIIRDELTLWLKVKESELGDKESMNGVRRAARYIEEYWGGMLPSEINRDSTAAWVVWWQTAYPDITMEGAIKYFKNFCRYLAEKTLLPIVPKIVDPNRPKYLAVRKKKKENILSLSDFGQIYTTAESPEHKLIILLMYTMATRITETLELRFDHEILLDLDEPIYRWSAGQNKADLWGEHALHKRLLEPLKALREARKIQGTDRLFPQARNPLAPLKEQQVDWAAWRARAKVSFHWTPHTFRHTCLTNLFNDPNNPQVLICKLYRVSLKTALETYIKVTSEGRLRMRDAIEVSI